MHWYIVLEDATVRRPIFKMKKKTIPTRRDVLQAKKILFGCIDVISDAREQRVLPTLNTNYSVELGHYWYGIAVF